MDRVEWCKFSENEAPKSKPPKKKLKLSVPKDKESRWQYVDNATEAAFGKQFVPKNSTTSTKWAVSNFVAWRNGRNTRDQIHEISMRAIGSTCSKIWHC